MVLVGAGSKRGVWVWFLARRAAPVGYVDGFVLMILRCGVGRLGLVLSVAPQLLCVVWSSCRAGCLVRGGSVDRFVVGPARGLVGWRVLCVSLGGRRSLTSSVVPPPLGWVGAAHDVFRARGARPAGLYVCRVRE